ncbi:hypothetical protein ACFSJ3_10055 [Corallincola platygyrae]|uniref:DUF4124 domain-containing protein n=1 Tax=Corallincola platygyrae TaxID=1193278 RepID=A0ABW4XPE8_9GAMM
MLAVPTVVGQSKSLYQCKDGSFSDTPCPGGKIIEVPPTNTAKSEQPREPLMEEKQAKPEPKPTPSGPPIPIKCRDLTLAQKSEIKTQLRFQNIVPCMTEQQAKSIIRNKQHSEYIYPAGGNNVFKEWIFTPPTPRFPHRIYIENGYVVETK